MKKIIFKTLLTSFAFFLLVGYIKAQASHSQKKSSSTKQKNVVRITANTPNEKGSKQLFNGKDLTGWKHVGKGDMIVEDGLIHGQGGMGLLYWTKEKLANCTIHVVYKMQKENSNSGVFIRVPIEPHEEWMPVFYGYEVQIDNHPETSGEDDHHITGTLYSLTKPLAKPGKPGPEWNTMDITLKGSRTIVYVNGEKVTDYKEGDPVPERKFDFEPYPGKRPDSGYFGLQNHGDSDVVYFKEVSVKPLTNNSHNGKK